MKRVNVVSGDSICPFPLPSTLSPSSLCSSGCMSLPFSEGLQFIRWFLKDTGLLRIKGIIFLIWNLRHLDLTLVGMFWGQSISSLTGNYLLTLFLRQGQVSRRDIFMYMNQSWQAATLRGPRQAVRSRLSSLWSTLSPSACLLGMAPIIGWDAQEGQPWNLSCWNGSASELGISGS